MLTPQKKKEYRIVNKVFDNRESIENEFGEVSYAFFRENDGKLFVVAVSSLDMPYLKTDLLMDKVEFYGVDSFIKHEDIGVIL